MNDEEVLYHYGTPRHSGRYPWGSGKDPYQHSASLLGTYEYYKKKGFSKTQAAHAMGYSTTQFNKLYSNAVQEQKAARIAEWQKLADKGWSPEKISERTGVPASTIRSALKTKGATKVIRAREATAQMLKERLEEYPYLDVSPGNAELLGISPSTLDKAIDKMKAEGYTTQKIYIKQVTNPEKYTTMNILTKEGVTTGEILANKDQIRIVTDWVSKDDGASWLGIKKPVSVDASRVQIRYAEDGGKNMDGVIELRDGIPELSMGNSRYAQVRINVNDTHYIKGMAIYSDDLPDGVDIRFNTNKTKDVPMLGSKDNSVLKELKKDKETKEINWDNPFGSLIKIEDGQVVGQREYIDSDGKTKLSPINIVKEAGDWNEWSKNLSSQFLSKQYDTTIKKQLSLAYDVKKDQFDEIMELTNPEVKVKLLAEFADECDSSAVHLKAAAMPRQSTKVILPVPGLKDGEVYAPTYKHGEQVALIRHPHAGPFEIPILTVNKRSKEGQQIVGNLAVDAIGINPKAAQQLSGADFDGDTVIVIPLAGQKIKASSPLKQLENFDPSDAYPAYEGMPRVGKETGFHKQTEMGKVSNLITDMSIRGATNDELARAVKHSMVVIDAEKHNLDWRASERDNDIAALKEKYQGGANRGAATLISKAKGTEYVNDRKQDNYVYTDPITGRSKQYAFNPETGEKTYTETGKTLTRFFDTETGKRVTYSIDPETKERVWKTTGKNAVVVDEDNVMPRDTDDLKKGKSTHMAERSDAFDLSSGTKKEAMYAEYANNLKSLAKQARVAIVGAGKTTYNPSAAEAYAKEVADLDRKLKVALSNAPYERQAQVIATKRVEERLRSNPELRNDMDDLKKLRTEAITAARNEVGASRQKRLIDITDREWDAILSGAVKPTRINDILKNANPDQVKKLATPHDSKHSLTNAQISRVKAMSRNGATLEEMADSLGVSAVTVYRALNE